MRKSFLKIIFVFLFSVIPVLSLAQSQNDVPKAKDPEWNATIAPFYAPENTNENTTIKKGAKCSGEQTCFATINFVIDGDTIQLTTGEKVRYIGVDTPETKHPVKKVECFGKEAFEKNKQLVLNREVRLEKDVSDKDKYGRLLRYVYIVADMESAKETFVNDYLVRFGFASAATFPPDVKFSQEFLAAEREARNNQRGLWAEGVCEEKSQEILDKKIKEKINSVKKDYPKNHYGFREDLIKEIIKLTNAPLDRIGYWVYTTLKDITR